MCIYGTLGRCDFFIQVKWVVKKRTVRKSVDIWTWRKKKTKLPKTDQGEGRGGRDGMQKKHEGDAERKDPFLFSSIMGDNL